MKYKLPKPEDYPEIKEYSFQLSRAYGKIYSEFLTVLVTIDTVLDSENKDDPIEREIHEKMFRNIMDKYKV